MSHPSLTPAQAERLAMLIEEAAEIQQAATKILRHGYDSHHPDDEKKTPNGTLLCEELTDFCAVTVVMGMAGDLSLIHI